MPRHKHDLETEIPCATSNAVHFTPGHSASSLVLVPTKGRNAVACVNRGFLESVREIRCMKTAAEIMPEDK